MAAEVYFFECHGARFSVTIDIAEGAPTTMSAPNLRVLEGSWKTWRLDVDPNRPGLEGVRIRRSVSASGGEHPHGNLSPAESAATGFMMMVTSGGDLYRIAAGYGVVSRFYSAAEWDAQRAAWEATL